jgi:putative transposase
MKRKRHSPEQIVRKLREAEAGLAAGTALDQVCKKLGVSEATYHRWKKQYGGAGAEEVRRLKELEKENARLKAVVADLELDKRILKEALEGNY